MKRAKKKTAAPKLPPELRELHKMCMTCRRIHSRIMNREIRQRVKLDKWRAEHVIEWIKKGEREAVLSFTSGNERQIAYAIEGLMRCDYTPGWALELIERGP